MYSSSPERYPSEKSVYDYASPSSCPLFYNFTSSQEDRLLEPVQEPGKLLTYPYCPCPITKGRIEKNKRNMLPYLTEFYPLQILQQSKIQQRFPALKEVANNNNRNYRIINPTFRTMIIGFCHY